MRYLKLCFVVAVLVVFSSCKRTPSQPVSTKSAMNASIRFGLAVYLLPEHAKHPHPYQQEDISTLIKGRYHQFKIVDKLPEEPVEMLVCIHVNTDVGKDYAPPDETTLKYSAQGLTPAQKKELKASKEALIFEFAHPKAQVWTALKSADELVENVARQTRGLIWDKTTRQVFTPEEWHKTRLSEEAWSEKVPTISSQTVIQSYPSGEYTREISLGMEKMGLPDVVVQEVPQSSSGFTSKLINLYCQSLAENELVNTVGNVQLDIQRVRNKHMRDEQTKSMEPNGLGHGCVALQVGHWEEGDPHNRLVELTGDRYSGADGHARQDKLISSLYGWDDKVHRVQHTAELLEESRKEKAKLPELRKAFNAGLEPGEYILLKAPFQTPEGGHEWMWVEVTKWNNKKIRGPLDNTPDEIPSLHPGQIVDINEDDVFDYIRQYPDKHQEGNTTLPILERLDDEPGSGHTPIVHPEDPDCSNSPV